MTNVNIVKLILFFILQTILIKDITDFKKKHQLYQLPNSFMPAGHTKSKL